MRSQTAWPVVCIIAWFLVIKPATAGFNFALKNLTLGANLVLQWSPVDESSYPLTVQVRFFNQTDNGVFSIRSAVARNVMEDKVKWNNAPSPLEYIPTADYELILLPESGGPRLGYVGLFKMIGDDDEDDEAADKKDLQTDRDRGGNSKVGIVTGVCVGVGIPAVLGAAWWMRKSRRSREQERLKGRAHVR